jgi:hypothetical protein
VGAWRTIGTSEKPSTTKPNARRPNRSTAKRANRSRPTATRATDRSTGFDVRPAEQSSPPGSSVYGTHSRVAPRRKRSRSSTRRRHPDDEEGEPER